MQKENTPSEKGPVESRDTFDPDADFEALQKATQQGLWGRIGARFNELLQERRGNRQERNAVVESRNRPEVRADDLAIRRARNVNTVKMVIPEGVIIEGHLTGGSDTEISGRIEGNLSVEGRLYLGVEALVTGDVRAGSCLIEGLVEGNVECSEDLDLEKTGRLNADVLSGRRINLAGQVYGNVTTPGSLRLASSAKVTGDIRARALVMEDGAILNGVCAMRAPAQRSENKK